MEDFVLKDVRIGWQEPDTPWKNAFWFRDSHDITLESFRSDATPPAVVESPIALDCCEDITFSQHRVR